MIYWVDHGTFLLFSQKNKISRLLLDPSLPDEVPDMVLPIKRARSIQAVSYDSVDGMIYWVDHGRGEQPARQVIRRTGSCHTIWLSTLGPRPFTGPVRTPTPSMPP